MKLDMRLFVFFFFKQKTAYEMRISDWSSDVCSSDIQDRSALLSLALGFNKAHLGPLGRHHNRLSIGCDVLLALHKWAHVAWRDQPDLMAQSAQHTGPVMSATARLHYDRGVRKSAVSGKRW